MTRMPLAANLVLVAAHETTHLAQLERDGRINASNPETYSTDPQEQEAWSMLSSFKSDLYPSAEGEVWAASGIFEVPIAPDRRSRRWTLNSSAGRTRNGSARPTGSE